MSINYEKIGKAIVDWFDEEENQETAKEIGKVVLSKAKNIKESIKGEENINKVDTKTKYIAYVNECAESQIVPMSYEDYREAITDKCQQFYEQYTSLVIAKGWKPISFNHFRHIYNIVTNE